MCATKTVQPIDGRKITGKSVQENKHIERLIECGGDVEAAEALVKRLTGGEQPQDIFEDTAVKSFIDLVVTLSRSDGRLTSVS